MGCDVWVSLPPLVLADGQEPVPLKRGRGRGTAGLLPALSGSVSLRGTAGLLPAVSGMDVRLVEWGDESGEDALVVLFDEAELLELLLRPGSSPAHLEGERGRTFVSLSRGVEL